MKTDFLLELQTNNSEILFFTVDHVPISLETDIPTMKVDMDTKFKCSVQSIKGGENLTQYIQLFMVIQSKKY